jgi:hypothetical protein
MGAEPVDEDKSSLSRRGHPSPVEDAGAGEFFHGRHYITLSRRHNTLFRAGLFCMIFAQERADSGLGIMATSW